MPKVSPSRQARRFNAHPSPYWLILRTDATFMFAAAIARDQALVVLVYFPWSIGFIARWLLEGLINGEAYPSPTQ